jgi:PadR family transcriptional regulator, regulatory protein PadR
MQRGELLGSLEHVVLLALARLDGTAHGALIRREIEARTGRDLSIGAVYTTLDRLSEKGFVTSTTSAPTPERGGRAKRVFRLEPAGRRALHTSARTLRAMADGLNARWRPA